MAAERRERPFIDWEIGRGELQVRLYERNGSLEYELEGESGKRAHYQAMLSCMIPRFGGVLRKRMSREFPPPKLPGMKMSQSTRFGYASDLEMSALNYAYHWIQISEENARDGIYDKLAEFAGISDGQLWLDIGCGNCRLVEAVLKRQKPVALGNDVNEYLLESGRQLLQSQGHKVAANFNYDIVSDRELGWRLEFPMQPGFQLGNVSLLLDDNRKAKLTEKLLPGKLDKATYTFLGGMSGTIGYEMGDVVTYGRNTAAANEIIRMQAMKRVLGLMKVGGELIVSAPGLYEMPRQAELGVEEIGKLEIPYERRLSARIDFKYGPNDGTKVDGVPVYAWKLRKKY
jgi:SAM-dependent methyltransferase